MGLFLGSNCDGVFPVHLLVILVSFRLRLVNPLSPWGALPRSVRLPLSLRMQ